MGRRRSSNLSFQERLDLNPEISHGLVAILLFVVAGLAILSFFQMAGVAGEFIDSLLAICFGQVRYVFPVILFIIGILIIKDLDYDYRPTHFWGALIFFLSFNGLIHLKYEPTQMLDLALQGLGGGLAGTALAWPLGTYLGYWGGLIILIALILVGIIFLFNTSLAQIVNLHKKLFSAFGWFGGQILSFGNVFKKDKGVQVQGEYELNKVENNEQEEQPEEEEDNRPFAHRTISKVKKEEENEEVEEEEEKPITPFKPKVIIRDLPPIELLVASKSKPTSGDIKSNAEMIRDTFHNFGIEVDMGEVRVGPSVTQYAMKPAKGVKLTRITTLSNDLALALAAHPIRIEAPIPGKSLVGIEVPNQKVAMVTLRELVESQEFQRREHNLMLALGKDVGGKVWFADLPKMPHLLIAGATGSGKTVCINTVILSLLYQNTAETLRFIMVDPKRVELTLYNGIPHLLTPVITDAHKTVNALKWTIGEMERRFDVLAKAGKRDIHSFNKISSEPLPHIVFVIDELADLMATSASEVEAGIIRIAQMARAVGIHLIVATQRPSVDVITGLMKANIPARIAFSVASVIDSRTILDCPGAEKLLGRGDMLFLTAELSKPKRIQGAYVSEEEMKHVVDHLKGDEPPEYDDTIVAKDSNGKSMNLFGSANDDQDPLFDEAKRVIIESGKASASLLQRRMKVGYARAARLLDELEEAGMVGPADGAKPREIFTEHMDAAPKAAPEMPMNEQTMDAGGSIFDSPEEIEETTIDDLDLNEQPDEQEEEEEIDENGPGNTAPQGQF